MSRSGQGFTTHCNSQSPIFTYISSCTHASALEWQQLHLHNQGWVPRGLMLELSPPVQARRALTSLRTLLLHGGGWGSPPGRLHYRVWVCDGHKTLPCNRV